MRRRDPRSPRARSPRRSGEGRARPGRPRSVASRGDQLSPRTRGALDEIAGDVATLAGVPVVAIWSADEDKRTLGVAAAAGEAAASLPLVTLPYGIGGIGWVAVNRTGLEVPDVFVDSRFVGHDWRRSHRLTSFCGVPLVLGDRLLGVIALDGREPIDLTAGQRERLAGLAAKAVEMLDRVREEAEALRRHEELAASRDELAARVREMTALVAVAEVVGTTVDPVEAFRLICRELCRLTGADTVVAYQLDREQSTIAPVAGYHVPVTAREGLEGARLALAELRFGGSLFGEKRVVWSDDAPNDPRFANSFFTRFPHQSCALISLKVDDETSGVLHLVWWKKPRRFDEHEIALLQAVGRQASVILRNARLLGLHAVTRLANAAAHEINNPLAVIVGHLQLFARTAKDAERRHIDRALDAADRIQDMVRRLMRITRLKDLESSKNLPPTLDLRGSSPEE